MLVTFDVECKVTMAGRNLCHTKGLVQSLLELCNPKLRASFVKENYCSQTNINQSPQTA